MTITFKNGIPYDESGNKIDLNLPENMEIVNRDKFFDELISCDAIRNKQFVEEQRNSTDLIDMMRLVLCSYQTASEKIEYLKQRVSELQRQLK